MLFIVSVALSLVMFSVAQNNADTKISELNTKVVQLEKQLAENQATVKKISEFTAVNAIFTMQDKTQQGYFMVYSKLKDKYSTSTWVLTWLDNLMTY